VTVGPDARFGADIMGSQLPPTVVVLWPLAVRKGCGLVPDTIHSVRTPPPPWSPFFLTLGGHLAMRRVLHLRMVSQCAVLEDFGIFLVLADKVGGVRSRVFLVSLTAFIVALCLPYRGPRSLITWSIKHFAGTPKAQWGQGRALLYRRQPWW